MQASSLAILFLAIVLALAAEQVTIAIILSIALVVFLVFYFLAKTASAAKETSGVFSRGVMDDLEKAKGQHPKAVAEIGKLLETGGSKIGEAAWAKEKEVYKSVGLMERVGVASKNLLEGLGKLFK